MCTIQPRRTRVRTPHLPVLVDALAARDHGFEVLGPDTVVVETIAADDLGWLAAGAGVVIYEMTQVDDG
jgi:hypothetical protein